MEEEFTFEEAKKMKTVTTALRKKVDAFMAVIAEDHIDHQLEKEKQDAAYQAVHDYENVCDEAEQIVRQCSEKGKTMQIRKLVQEARQANTVNVITYQRAMLKFNKRKQEYENCSRLTRDYFSPRSRSADDVWGDEVKETYPEMKCMFIVLFILTSLFIVCTFFVSVSTPKTRSRIVQHRQAALKQHLGHTIATDLSSSFSHMLHLNNVQNEDLPLQKTYPSSPVSIHDQVHDGL